MLEETCSCPRVVRTYAPGSDGHYIVQVVPAAWVTHPFLEIGRLVGHFLNHLRCLVADKFPVQGAPEAGATPEGKYAVAHIYRYRLITLHR